MKLPAGLLCTGIVLAFLGPIGVVAQQSAEALYELSSDYSGHVFDPGHNAIYLTLTGRRALVRLSLTNGAETAALPLSLFPSAMTMTPNRQWLFIGEGSTTELRGKIAEIDLTTGTLSRELDLPFTPHGLTATDAKLLVVSSLSADGQGPEVRLFDTASGAISARTVTTTYGPHTLDPSQLSIFAYGLGNRFSPVVRGFFDRTELRFTSLRTSRYGSEDGRVMVGTVVAFPDGSLLSMGIKFIAAHPTMRRPTCCF